MLFIIIIIIIIIIISFNVIRNSQVLLAQLVRSYPDYKYTIVPKILSVIENSRK